MISLKCGAVSHRPSEIGNKVRGFVYTVFVLEEIYDCLVSAPQINIKLGKCKAQDS